MSVNRIDLVPKLLNRDDGVWIGFGCRLGLNDGRIIQVRRSDEEPVCQKEVPIHPTEVRDWPHGRVRREAGERRAVPVVQRSAGENRQQRLRVVKSHLTTAANVREHHHVPKRAHRDELRAHHAVEHVVPLNATTVEPGAYRELLNPVSRPQVALAQSGWLNDGHQVARVAAAKVAGPVRVDTAEEWDLHYFFLAVLAEALNAAAVGAPLEPGLRIRSLLPASMRSRFAWMLP